MFKWRYLKNWSQSSKTKVILLQNLDTRKKRFFFVALCYDRLELTR